MGDLGLGTTDDQVLVVVGVAMLVLVLLGALERRRHRRHLHAVPVRISVNGSRGKSTVTRLLTGALAEADRRPLGKTTGTDPKLLFGWDLDGEEDIHRRPEGPNINEQMAVVERAHDEGAGALVAECMAVDPEYQLTFHAELLDVTHLLICNALEDHLEEMGPSVADVAEVFAASIPAGRKVIATPEPWLDRYRDVADARGAELIVADPDAVTDDQLRGYNHLVLPEHVALCLALTRDLGIPDAVALRGMRRAPADPHAARVTPIGDPDDPAFFVNAFAANDPTSTLALWRHVEERDLPSDALTVIVHCREDRGDRTRLFAERVLPELPIDHLIVTGRQTQPILRPAHAGKVPGDLTDLSGAPADEVVAALDGTLRHRVVFGVGNLHGGGAAIAEALQDLATSPHLDEDDPSTRQGVA